MGEKGSLKNMLKDFFKIQKKLKKKKELEQEEKQIKEIEKRKKRKAKILIIIGYLGSLITFPFTKKRKNTPTNSSPNSTYIKNSKTKLQNINSNYNIQRPQNINLIKLNKKKQIQNKPIAKVNNTSFQKIKPNFYLNQQSINKQPTLIKSQTKQNNSTSQKIKKDNRNNKYVANAVIVGALASHFAGKVSKEILNSVNTIFTDIPENNITNEHEEYSNLKINRIDNSSTNNFIKIQHDNNLTHNKINTINDKVNTSSKHNEHGIEQVSQTINIALEYKENIKETTQKENNQPQNHIREESNIKKINISKEKIDHNKTSELKSEQLNENFKLPTIDIKNAFQMINNDISKQEMELEQIKQYLQNTDPKEQKLISIIKEKTFTLLNPVFSLFQNTIFGKLVHSVIINHRIKYIRKITNQQYQIKYYNLKTILKNINSQKEIMINNIKINNNSLEEIESLKMELLKLNIESLEVLKTFQYLTNLENNIIKQNNKIKSQIEKANELEKKGKIKIKKLKAS